VSQPLRRAELVAFAEHSIARGSKSFGMASKLFDRATRERAWLLYAWCRATDDLADGQEMGHGMQPVADPQVRLSTIRTLTDQALRGEATGNPAFDCLGVVAAECAIPLHLPQDLVEGFALDAQGFRPRDEADLYRYCYHVAGSVGCMMAIVMGVPAKDDPTLDRACDLGLAFQLANIARDIGEDEAAGRCYLPLDWLTEVDIPPGEEMRPPYRKRIALLAARLADRAALFEESARHGTPALPFRSAWAVLAAAGIYGDIGREVKIRGEHAWDKRVSTSKSEKLGWLLKSLAQSVQRKRRWPAQPRPMNLWTRPG
jgi:phytoene synthase